MAREQGGVRTRPRANLQHRRACEVVERHLDGGEVTAPSEQVFQLVESAAERCRIEPVFVAGVALPVQVAPPFLDVVLDGAEGSVGDQRIGARFGVPRERRRTGAAAKAPVGGNGEIRRETLRAAQQVSGVGAREFSRRRAQYLPHIGSLAMASSTLSRSAGLSTEKDGMCG